MLFRSVVLSRIAALEPDLITLDVEMPVMDGLETLREIEKSYPDLGVIMLSTLTKRGSEITMKALELGAFDFIAKSDAEARQENVQTLKNALTPRVTVFVRRRKPGGGAPPAFARPARGRGRGGPARPAPSAPAPDENLCREFNME